MEELKNSSLKKLPLFEVSNIIPLMWPCLFLNTQLMLGHFLYRSQNFISTFTSLFGQFLNPIAVPNENFDHYNTLPEMQQHDYYTITGLFHGRIFLASYF